MEDACFKIDVGMMCTQKNNCFTAYSNLLLLYPYLHDTGFGIIIDFNHCESTYTTTDGNVLCTDQNNWQRNIKTNVQTTNKMFDECQALICLSTIL